jgi:hypothetical protein
MENDQGLLKLILTPLSGRFFLPIGLIERDAVAGVSFGITKSFSSCLDWRYIKA